MAPPPVHGLNSAEILAMLSDEDDDDLDLLEISDEEEDELEAAPPDTVEVMGENGDMVVLPLEEVENFVIPGTFVISEPEEEPQLPVTYATLGNLQPDEEPRLTPPPDENIAFVPSPGSQEGLFVFAVTFF